MNYYERHLGDYARNAGHLSMLEHGAYTCILDRYYTTEAGIPADQVYRLARAITAAERKAVDSVLREFFRLEGGVWVNDRCDQEIAKAQTKIKAARENGKLGGRPKATEPEPNGNPPGNPLGPESVTQTKAHQTPDTRHQKEIPSTLSRAPGFPSEKPALALVPDASPPKAKGPTDCPHQALLALWAEVLPSMPQHNADLWRGARADHLRARWRETATVKAWGSEADGIEYFRRLFAYVGRSKFLTGRGHAHGDKPPFICTLEWLVKPANWAKVIEGNYHPEAA